ncbi:MAG: flagellar basal body P-ring protein FlgI [Xanthomonadaceae bacterium]|nr:flagellar basal body P-ring protein FlgI [Xanthomonadaceae bacterium]
MKSFAVVLLGVALIASGSAARAERVGDLARVAGVRSNQLVGYGLVVGLDGTGDQTSQAPFTTQSLENMLQQFGVTVPANVRPQLRNVAAVTITAELPPFAKPGQTLDITVSSIGNAKSLRGGSLLMTPLRGADGEVYALAQGNVVVGGVGASGASGSSVTVNILNSGRIPSGALVERSVPSAFAASDGLVFNLNTPNFSTASHLAAAINENLGEGVAQALDATSVAVRAPVSADQRVSFVGVINDIEVQPGTAPARVIVNARTGTVVIGANVTVSAAAVAHGGIEVSISEQPRASQPGAFSNGETVVLPSTGVQITERGGTAFTFGPGVNLDEIVSAINRVGAAPSDLISILQALKEAGALRAELVII